MSSEPAVRVRNLSKCYNIYAAPEDRLKQAVLPRLQRLVSPLVRTVAPGKAMPRSYYREFWALRDVGFDVAPGETFGVIGRNGSGKSTLLQLVCGILAPTAGEAAIRGKVAALLELGAGFNPEFTGRENVHLNGAIFGMSREQVDDRFDAIASFADIGGFIDQPVKTYSSGMYLRLAFAVVAHVDADILVIDEALAVGDAFFQQKCMRFLRKFKETGTILFVSHDTNAVINLCSRALWLEEGMIKQIGSAKEICEGYFATVYAEAAGIPANKATLPVPPKARAKADFPDRPPREVNAKTPVARPALGQVIEVFSFNFDAPSFGSGDARIIDVRLLDAAGETLAWIEGGEEVEVAVRATCNAEIESPILGFMVKDRLGQPLFGDNTYRTYADRPLQAKAGEILEARFRFTLPFLRSGNYSIAAAIASGTLQQHVQHHWIHDALILTVHSSCQNGVLIGIPMQSITVRQYESQGALRTATP